MTGDQVTVERIVKPGANTVERVTFLDALKATGIVMVVAVHVLSGLPLAPELEDSLLFIVGTVAVPLFLLADGFLFAHQWTGKADFSYGEYIKKSSVRLLVPWAAFSGLYMAMRAGTEMLGLTPDTIIIGNSCGGLIKVLYLSQLSHHMYFLLSLFLVRLGTVIVQPMLTWSRLAWSGTLLLYIGLYVSSNLKQWFFPGADPVLLALWALQFYILGVLLQKWHEQVRAAAVWLSPGGLALAAAGWWFLPASSLFIVQLLYLVGTYATLLSLTDVTRWRFTMGRDTMGIYLLHSPYVLWVVVSMLLTFAPASPVGTFLVATATASAISWGITRMIAKHPMGRVILGHPQFSDSGIAMDRCSEVRT
jgi:surface polysaccharide O-acyltransferase-like enzyme